MSQMVLPEMVVFLLMLFLHSGSIYSVDVSCLR